MKHFKKIHKLSDHNQALTAIIAFLVILSISLTIVESVSTGITKETQQLFFAIHMSILLVFFFELVYRIAIAPRIFPEYSSAKARVLFIAHPLTIIDIIVIIPLFLGFIHPDLGAANFVVFRILRLTSLLNIFKLYRSSKIIRVLFEVMREVWNELLIAAILAFQIILISSILIYHFESAINPDINTFFDGLYWSVMSITTVGYGDIVPITVGGKIVGMIGAVLGIGLVALPAGILAAGFFRAMREERIHESRARKKKLKHWFKEEEEVDLIPLD